MLVSDPKKNKLSIEVKDSLGFTDLTVGTAEVRLLNLLAYAFVCYYIIVSDVGNV